MKTSLRAATAIALLGTLGTASAALAGPPGKASGAPRPGSPPAAAPPAGRTGDAAPATAAPPASGGGAGVGLAVLGGLVVLGVGGFLAWRAMSGSGGGGKGDGRAPEPILAERKHEWELRMSEEQEAALLRGVQAWRDSPGNSLYLSHDDAIITFYEPRRMLVSLHQLTDAFLAAGPAAVADPVAWVRGLFERWATSEVPGVLHLRTGWYASPVDGLDHEKFSTLCYETLTNPQPYIEGTQGSSADENSGHLTLKVEVGGPLNAFCVDLSRLLPKVVEARAAQPGAPLVELVRPVLLAMSRGELAGAMWTRGSASDAEKDLLARVIAAGAPRAR